MPDSHHLETVPTLDKQDRVKLGLPLTIASPAHDRHHSVPPMQRLMMVMVLPKPNQMNEKSQDIFVDGRLQSGNRHLYEGVGSGDGHGDGDGVGDGHGDGDGDGDGHGGKDGHGHGFTW